MAVNLKRIQSFNLGPIVNSELSGIANVIQTENTIKLSKFYAVVSKGEMSYDEQIDYLDGLIANEEGSGIKSPDYAASLAKLIGDTKRLKKFDKVRETYNTALTNYYDNKDSYEEYVETLEDLLDGETDEDLKTELETQLQTARKDLNALKVNAIQTRATTAIADKSVSALDSSISEIKSRKSKALLADNEEEVALWDNVLSSLNSTLATVKITDAMNEMRYKVSTTGMTSTDKLNYFNSQITGADSSTPVTVDGIRYGSLKQYWETTTGEYIQSDYFTELQTELDQENLRVASVSKGGQVPISRIQQVNNFYNSLQNVALLKPFASTIEAEKNVAITTLTEGTANYLEAELASGRITDAQYKASLNTIQATTGSNFADTRLPTTPLGANINTPAGVPSPLYSPTPSVGPVPAVPKANTTPTIAPAATPVATTTAPKPVTPTTPVTTIPKAPTVTASTPTYYTVKAGDTLSGISSSQLGSATRWNELKTQDGKTFTDQTARTLQVGTVLVIPK